MIINELMIFDLTVDITQELIDTSHKGSRGFCPLARGLDKALTQHFKDNDTIRCRVDYTNIFFTMKLDGKRILGIMRFGFNPVGKELEQFEFWFDNGFKVKPFSFKLSCDGRRLGESDFNLKIELLSPIALEE